MSRKVTQIRATFQGNKIIVEWSMSKDNVDSENKTKLDNKQEAAELVKALILDMDN